MDEDGYVGDKEFSAIGNEDIADMNFIDLSGVLLEGNFQSIGSFRNPYEIAQFMDTELGQLQVAQVQREVNQHLGIEGTLTQGQVENILFRAQALQSGYMRPTVEVVVDPVTKALGFNSIEYSEYESAADEYMVATQEDVSSGSGNEESIWQGAGLHRENIMEMLFQAASRDGDKRVEHLVTSIEDEFARILPDEAYLMTLVDNLHETIDDLSARTVYQGNVAIYEAALGYLYGEDVKADTEKVLVPGKYPGYGKDLRNYLDDKEYGEYKESDPFLVGETVQAYVEDASGEDVGRAQGLISDEMSSVYESINDAFKRCASSAITVDEELKEALEYSEDGEEPTNYDPEGKFGSLKTPTISLIK